LRPTLSLLDSSLSLRMTPSNSLLAAHPLAYCILPTAYFYLDEVPINTFLSVCISLRAMPLPMATQLKGSSVT